MLTNMIPNYDQEVERLMDLAPMGFTLAFNLTFRGPQHFHTEYPEDWREIYNARNYTFVDPVLVWTIGATGNKRWSEIRLPDVRGVMTAAQNHDLNYGAVFSRRRGSKRSILSVARADRELSDLELEVIGARFDSWVDMVVGGPELTQGELDVLRGLKDGLAHHEIAEKLGVSESAIKQRTVKACGKLNAKNRIQAVAIAVARNYFDR